MAVSVIGIYKVVQVFLFIFNLYLDYTSNFSHNMMIPIPFLRSLLVRLWNVIQEIFYTECCVRASHVGLYYVLNFVSLRTKSNFGNEIDFLYINGYSCWLERSISQ